MGASNPTCHKHVNTHFFSLFWLYFHTESFDLKIIAQHPGFLCGFHVIQIIIDFRDRA